MKYKRKPVSHIYVVTDDNGHCKIGIAGNVANRIASLQVGNPYRLRLHKAWVMENEVVARAIENAVLSRCLRNGLCGEWVRARPEALSRLVERKLAYSNKPWNKPTNMLDIKYEKVRKEHAPIVPVGVIHG